MLSWLKSYTFTQQKHSSRKLKWQKPLTAASQPFALSYAKNLPPKRPVACRRPPTPAAALSLNEHWRAKTPANEQLTK